MFCNLTIKLPKPNYVFFTIATLAHLHLYVYGNKMKATEL